MQKIKEAKARFLAKYNPTQSFEVALARAINASVQRNRYLNQDDKDNYKVKRDIREQWKGILKNIANFHCEVRNERVYQGSIEMVKETVNLVSPKSQIKISHAQKSLAVYLKHLWCFDEDKIRAQYFPQIYPVQCPVDAIILRKIKWKGQPWTTVDCIHTHWKMIDAVKKYIEESGQKYSIHEWELINFLQ